MPRPKRNRTILSPPICNGFVPIGNTLKSDSGIDLSLEEFESIRLCDYDHLNHAEACQLMNVSRPTFARIYESARQKVATAFAEGLPIHFIGGKYSMSENWWKCNQCGSMFSSLAGEYLTKCVVCSSTNISSIHNNAANDECICPLCGAKLKHRHGQQCRQLYCPDCKQPMFNRRNARMAL
jgi:predicted DNA-binding protein (UPF0251 family)